MTTTSQEISIFAGRFGSGKTETALNYALRLAREGQSPLLVDLDIVTPYFRTRDRANELLLRGVEVVSPFPVAQHIHVAAISPQIQGAIEQLTRPVVIDLGGDEQGSRALAQHATVLRTRKHSTYFVANPYRPFMDSLDGIRMAINEIECSARTRVSHLVSNPNLMSESSPGAILEGHRLVQEASRALGLPIAFAVIDERLSGQLRRQDLGVELLVIHRFFPMLDSPD